MSGTTKKAFDLRRGDKVVYFGRTRTVDEVSDTWQPNDDRPYVQVWWTSGNMPSVIVADDELEVA